MKYFGTDGIRGRVNQEPLTPSFVQRLGQALVHHWEVDQGDSILLGHDGRLSHDMLRSALTSGILAAGGSVLNLGLCTTPALAFATDRETVAGGVMISASHNPYPDNGLKPFGPDGAKLMPEEEHTLEGLLDGSPRWSSAESVGREKNDDTPLESYVETLSGRYEPVGLSVLLDVAHGGASALARPVLEGLVDDLTVINHSPDGRNINQDCGSLHVEQLEETLADTGQDIAFALDGDGDRVLGMTPNGEILDGDRMLHLLARYGRFDRFSEGVAMTVMSNLALRRSLEEASVPFEVTPVGDREIYGELCRSNWHLGGEQSGHIIDRNWLATGDGLNTMLAVLQVLDERSEPVGEIVGELEPYPQVLHNVEVEAKPPLDSLPQAREIITQVEERMGEKGRVLVRYSGTEPLLRVMLEGESGFPLQQWAQDVGKDLVQVIRSHSNE